MPAPYFNDIHLYACCSHFSFKFYSKPTRLKCNYNVGSYCHNNLHSIKTWTLKNPSLAHLFVFIVIFITIILLYFARVLVIKILVQKTLVKLPSLLFRAYKIGTLLCVRDDRFFREHVSADQTDSKANISIFIDSTCVASV